MNVYECLQMEKWRELTMSDKEQLFNDTIKYFVSSRWPILNERLVTFEMCGYRLTTFEFLLGREEFVFIPGQRGVNLGWQEGVSGLPLEEVVRAELEQNAADVARYHQGIEQEELSEQEQEFLFKFEDEVGDYVSHVIQQINRRTSPARRVDIPPMIVAKESQAVGTSYQGKYHIVAGEFFGADAFWEEYAGAIVTKLNPELSLSESLTWDYPRQILQTGEYYLEQTEDLEHYYVYRHRPQNYGELWLDLHRQGFQLLAEDSLEFAIGAGTRRLFRWGNQIDLSSNHPLFSAQFKMGLPNMFGLNVSNFYQSYELTDRDDRLKMDAEVLANLGFLGPVLRQSAYYRPEKRINAVEDLSPLTYRYRKSIVLSRD